MTATASAIAARPKTALISLLVVAFLCGASAGAVVMRAYSEHLVTGYAVERPRMTLERWRKELDLSDDQSAQISMILDDFDKYYDSVIAEGHERILQVLKPEQRVKFERMLKKRN